MRMQDVHGEMCPVSCGDAATGTPMAPPRRSCVCMHRACVRTALIKQISTRPLPKWSLGVLSRQLRSRPGRPEQPLEVAEGEADTAPVEDEVVLADTLGPALLLVVDTLTPSERLAFVLHDVFAVPFDDIAPIVDRSPAAARQLASRARRRIQGSDASVASDRDRRREIVAAFLAASRAGDFQALIALLDPDAVLRADRAAVRAATANRDRGAPPLAPEVRGAAVVAATLAGRAQGAQLALVDGAPGAVWAPGGRPRAIFAFRVVGDTISEIEVVIDPSTVAAMPVVLL
jgi:hypothetical protein